MSIDNAQMLNYLINFFYPPRCAACEVRLGSGAVRHLCGECHAQIDRIPDPLCDICGVPLAAKRPAAPVPEGAQWCANWIGSPPDFTRARAVVRYSHGAAEGNREVVPSIIRRHKYGLDQSLASAPAVCLGEEWPLGDADDEVVIPVPLHRGRLRWRGFNQAAVLAVAVSRRLGRPLELSTLVRVRPPPPTGQNRVERVKNLNQAFAVQRPLRVASRRIPLIDEVMTTAATADQCARTLIAAGARRVDVLTRARAI
jgi:predicted amidophosphoribosyltransferase